MSSSDPAFFGRAMRGALVASAAAIALAACTVQPLYGPTPTGQAVVTTVASIGIEPADTRVGQQIRNALIFDLDGGDEPVNPLFT